jgi:hypothetical protein
VSILYPMAALVCWTFLILALVPIKRFRAASQGRVRARDFRLGESPDVPADVALANRNFMNLLELPVLFYVACLTLYVTKTADGTAVLLAWLYVALRVCHSLVHVTYNNVLHRLVPYAISVAVLLAMWVRAIIALSGG